MLMVPRWHTVKAPPLLLYRFLTYKDLHQHYFLFDLCYFVNVLFLVYLFAVPHSVPFFETLFVLTCGPLCWAIPMWRNSLVFHSVDKMTSLWLHVSPALSIWGLRWNYSRGFPDFNESVDTSVRTLLIYPMLVYMAWQILYLLKV